jgi:Meiotically up-regulated gene 113
MSLPVARRSWVALDKGGALTRCVVKSADSKVLARLGAYELSTLKKRRPTPTEEKIAARVAALLSGNCCYAFYAKPNHAVKIGLASNVLRRWWELEHGSGMPLQLLMVWKTDDPRSLEKKLHGRFVAHRGLGEWFSAGEVLPALIDEAAVARSSGAA